MKRQVLIVTGAALFVAGVFGCATQESLDDKETLDAALEAWTTTFNSHDAKALGREYTEDADLMMATGERYVGREAIEKSFVEFFSKNPNVRAEVSDVSRRFLVVATGRGDARMIGVRERAWSRREIAARVVAVEAAGDGEPVVDRRGGRLDVATSLEAHVVFEEITGAELREYPRGAPEPAPEVEETVAVGSKRARGETSSRLGVEEVVDLSDVVAVAVPESVGRQAAGHLVTVDEDEGPVSRCVHDSLLEADSSLRSRAAARAKNSFSDIGSPPRRELDACVDVGLGVVAERKLGRFEGKERTW